MQDKHYHHNLNVGGGNCGMYNVSCCCILLAGRTHTTCPRSYDSLLRLCAYRDACMNVYMHVNAVLSDGA